MLPFRLLAKHRDITAGLVAQALQYGAVLLLLPFIVTHLAKAEVSIWFVFVTIQGLVVLADFGFQPSIARAFAAAFGGAPKLLREGLLAASDAAPNLQLARRILQASRTLYLVLSAVVLALLLSVGSWYVTSLAVHGGLARTEVLTAWALFSLAVTGNIYLLWAAPLLIGAGRIDQSYQFTIVTRGCFALLGIALLVAGGGLIALALANLVSIVVGAVFVAAVVRPLTGRFPDAPAALMESVLPTLWPNASKSGLVALGGFLIGRSNVLILSSFVGLTASGQYAFTLQVLTACMAMSQIPLVVALPTMTRLRVQEDRSGLARLYYARHLMQLLIFMTAAAGMLVLGPYLLTLIGSRVNILPRADLLLLSVVMLLEANHTNSAIALTTGNRIPFVWPALLSGAAAVILSLGAIRLGFGLTGAIAAQGLAQLTYNNWKWPVEIWKELRA